MGEKHIVCLFVRTAVITKKKQLPNNYSNREYIY